MTGPERERGSAIVEFHVIGMLLLVPLVYLLLAVLDVQRTAYGATHAAREAGRIYVATGDDTAARAAASVALRDQGIARADVDMSLTCDAAPCYRAGAEITIVVEAEVPLPFVPDVLVGGVNAVVPVQARHVTVVDRFRDLT